MPKSPKPRRNLKDKRILITAGPTWVPIDSVRVISNTATGRTGVMLAEEATRRGARVTLLLGPCECCCLDRRITLLRFKYFDELKDLVKRELSSGKYGTAIHSAAVSDYRPKRHYTHKIKSGNKRLRIDLIPTEKIIDLIKKIDTQLFLVGFKFQPQAKKGALIKRAKDLIDRAGLDLAVANSVNKAGYRAYIVNRTFSSRQLLNKKAVVKELLRMMRI